jgi:hypothetical protein
MAILGKGLIMPPRNIHRKPIKKEEVEKALDDLSKKILFRLEEKGDGTFSSTHEILGILEEEMVEFKESVKKNHEKDIRKELLDIAVGAVFAVACIDAGYMDWL